MANQDRKPVVLQVIPDLNTGGAERTTVDVAKALVEAGWTALVVSEGGRLTDELDAIGAKHIELPVKSKNPMTIWRNATRLQALIKEHSVDIIHARSRAPAWSSFRAAQRAKIPFVTTYHGIYGQKNAFKAFYNSVMARGDAVIANSNYTARLIEQRHPIAEDKISIIPRGSDLKALAPGAVSSERLQALSSAWGLKEGRPVVMNLARLTNWKGQGVLIDAMAELAEAGDDKTVAVLAGDAQGRDAYLADLKARIAKHGLADRVLLVGHCDDVPAALALADVSVVASIEPEAFGRAAVEAQAAHVPVIVSDLGAVPETVLGPPETDEADRTGWRVPPGKPEDLAIALRHALDLDSRALKALTTRAAAHVTRNFSVETMCARTLKVYQDLL
ncbi:glycosyltransferase family 4 protein [Roseibium algae]|uniref:Glycosyltransferase family 4 protein n=1 Tax=Roseibium algae TaxID=3123038 RepID=A0ABU8TQI5_9HYPH